MKTNVKTMPYITRSAYAQVQGKQGRHTDLSMWKLVFVGPKGQKYINAYAEHFMDMDFSYQWHGKMKGSNKNPYPFLSKVSF